MHEQNGSQQQKFGYWNETSVSFLFGAAHLGPTVSLIGFLVTRIDGSTPFPSRISLVQISISRPISAIN